MSVIPDLIGFSLSRAKNLLSDQVIINIKETITPFEDKKLERVMNEPIIVKQINKDNEVELTVSFFK